MAGYPRIGASPDGGLTWTLPQAIGYEQAMRFLLENRTVDADEALRLGFVGEVVDDEALEARLAEYCALARRARADREPPHEARDRARDRHRPRGPPALRAGQHPPRVRDARTRAEARKAFFEKRRPIFRGR